MNDDTNMSILTLTGNDNDFTLTLQQSGDNVPQMIGVYPRTLAGARAAVASTVSECDCYRPELILSLDGAA